MFIPLHDSNALVHIRRQYVTIGLIITNFTIWALMSLGDGNDSFVNAALLGLGFIPAVANDYAQLATGLAIVPEPATYVTYAFLHGSFFHVASNMLFLWVFGDNVEDALGHLRFLLFYLTCAVAGAFAHGLVYPQSEAPLIGASAATSGVVAAYLMLHPRVKIWVLAFGRIPLRLPAYIPLAGWVVFQFYMLAVDPYGSVSWAAHIGGILAGMVLVLVLRRRAVPLFDRTIVTPAAVTIRQRTESDLATSEQPGRPARWGRQK